MFDPSLQTIWGGGNLTAVFCDTGWEHPDTYKHVNDVCLQMGVRLITLKSKYDFVSLAAHKKRFPSTNARFCTSELKMKPMIDYVLSLKESCIIIQGIRAGESTARAAMEEECMYFKSYFQPNKKGRTENYRSKDVKEWCSQYDASVLRPIFKWQAKQSPWISVKERLPDENEDIIILCKHGAIFNGTYSNNVWFCMDGYIHDTYKGNPIYSSMSSIPSSWEPIAWMPIPKFEE